MPLDPVVGSALIGAGGSIGTSILNTAYDVYQQNKQRQWNEQMMDKQNQWSLDMWNRTNEYNTPSAQVQRLRDAGLNPMFYGLDGSSANSFESAQPLGYERSTMPLIGNPVDAALHAAQIANVRADTAKKSQESISEVTRREQMEIEIAKAHAQIDELYARADLTRSQKINLDIVNQYVDLQEQANLAYKESQTRLNDSQKRQIDELLEGQKQIQNATFEEIQARIDKIREEIKKIAGENSILAKDLEYYALNHSQNGFMGTGISLPNIIRAILGITDSSDNNDGSPAYNNQGAPPGSDYQDVNYPSSGVK